MSKENSTLRHDNEMLKIEVSDMQFQVNRAEHNEKLAKDNKDYFSQVTSEMQANEAKLQVCQNRLEIAEDKIIELEEELKLKTDECKNLLKDYDKMKKENESCKKKSGNPVHHLSRITNLDNSERKLSKVKNDTVFKLK